MNTRKFFYGIFAFIILAASVACTKDTADDSVYEQGVDRTKVTTGPQQSVDRTKVTTGPQQSVDRTKVTSSNQRD